MNAYEKLQTARSQTRPTARSYIEKLFQERTELHGDRKYADDAAIIGGIGMLGDIPATFIGIERGRNLEERIRCNFGCPMPEGYRKALRLMRQAEKFHRPVICIRLSAIACPCPRSSASSPQNAPEVSTKQMTGLWNFSACLIRRSALR